MPSPMKLIESTVNEMNMPGITPMRVVWPGMFISLTVLSINFMGDGIRDALDPRLRGRS